MVKWKIEMFNFRDKIDRDFAQKLLQRNKLTKQIEEELTDGIYILLEKYKQQDYLVEDPNEMVAIKCLMSKLTGLKNNLWWWD